MKDYTIEEIKLDTIPEENYPAAALPDTEDCYTDTLPLSAGQANGKRKILVPELTSMTKYLFDPTLGNQRLPLYSYLNRLLRTGRLSSVVGFRVMDKSINKDVCSFPGVSFWKIDRENFYADVEVKLLLKTRDGIREWTGVLECWCSFEDGFSCSIEDLTERTDRREQGFDCLNPVLVPYYNNTRIDEIAEEIWVKYDMPEALTFPTARNAYELARRMGLNIEYYPIYDHNGIDSVIFFADTTIKIGQDKTETRSDGTKERIIESEPKTICIPANTIVINTNVIKKDYSSFNIFHECIHYELHYAFFRLQAMSSNDIRLVNTIEIEVDDTKKYTDPIYFMEKQANRGAYGLMMPVVNTRELIMDECGKAEEYQHLGEMYEIAGKAIAKTLGLPHFRVRARMVQLGYIEARGALNYVDKKLIKPFAFDVESWKSEEHTFVIDTKAVDELKRTCEDFRNIMISRKYIYVDGHIVRNSPKYVIPWENGTVLTDWANAHVDACCLRFVREYVQTQLGTYTFGKMYYDAEYVKRTLFFLDDMINKRHLDEVDAKIEYKHDFPRTFIESFDMLMRKNGDTRETMSEKLNTTSKSLREWLMDPEKRITIDFVVVIALLWKLPDWISLMLLDRACIHLNEYDRRHQALDHILRVLWDKGIDEANSFLESMRLEPLKY